MWVPAYHTIVQNTNETTSSAVQAALFVDSRATFARAAARCTARALRAASTTFSVEVRESQQQHHHAESYARCEAELDEQRRRTHDDAAAAEEEHDLATSKTAFDLLAVSDEEKILSAALAQLERDYLL
jgi:molecular chaperone GrpE (heat shock protein)